MSAVVLDDEVVELAVLWTEHLLALLRAYAHHRGKALDEHRVLIMRQAAELLADPDRTAGGGTERRSIRSMDFVIIQRHTKPVVIHDGPARWFALNQLHVVVRR